MAGIRSELNLGLLRVVPRAPAVLWKEDSAMAVIKTGSLGFAGAAEDDRVRYINSFRRLLDGLDGPLQVVIEVLPGSGTDFSSPPMPLDFDDMRVADMFFVDDTSQSSSAHRFVTSLATPEQNVKRLEPALREIGVRFQRCPPSARRERWAVSARTFSGYSLRRLCWGVGRIFLETARAVLRSSPGRCRAIPSASILMTPQCSTPGWKNCGKPAVFEGVSGS